MYDDEYVEGYPVDGSYFTSKVMSNINDEYTYYLGSHSNPVEITCINHTYGTDGVCVNCGIECSHTYGTDGVCTECGKICNHTYGNDNVCTECGRIGTIGYKLTIGTRNYPITRETTFADLIELTKNDEIKFTADSENRIKYGANYFIYCHVQTYQSADGENPGTGSPDDCCPVYTTESPVTLWDVERDDNFEEHQQREEGEEYSVFSGYYLTPTLTNNYNDWDFSYQITIVEGVI